MERPRKWDVDYEKLDCREMLEELLRENVVDPGFRGLDQKLRNAAAQNPIDNFITMEEFKDIWWDINADLTGEEFDLIVRYCDLGVDKDDKPTVNCEDFLQFLDWVKDEYRKSLNRRREENQNQNQ